MSKVIRTITFGLKIFIDTSLGFSNKVILPESVINEIMREFANLLKSHVADRFISVGVIGFKFQRYSFLHSTLDIQRHFTAHRTQANQTTDHYQ